MPLMTADALPGGAFASRRRLVRAGGRLEKSAAVIVLIAPGRRFIAGRTPLIAVSSSRTASDGPKSHFSARWSCPSAARTQLNSHRNSYSQWTA
ncbi:hypothetical protein ATKI12_6892 [Kitasatospora sp. Ki12]